MKVHKSIKTILKVSYLFLKIFLVLVIILILIITIIVFYSRYRRINGFKEFYHKAFQLIEEKYDSNIYLSDRDYNSYIILEFTAKRGFEDIYNANDLPKLEFYTLVGHEIFDCFKDEFTEELEYDKAHETNYFVFPVYITIKYGNSPDEYVSLELYENDWRE